jgi:hypothetical protein
MTTSRSSLSYAKLAIILGILSAFGPLSIDMYLPALPTIARDFGTETAVVYRSVKFSMAPFLTAWDAACRCSLAVGFICSLASAVHWFPLSKA